MSVEVGPSGAVAVAGPNISIVNEGPVGPGFKLENTMPYTLGEITFNEKPLVAPSEQVLNVADVISEAESILSQARILTPIAPPQPEPLVENSVVVEARHWLGLIEPRIEPKLDNQPLSRIARVPISEPTVRSENSLAAQVFQQEVQDVIKEEEVKTADKTDEFSIKEEEEATEFKLKYVEHEEVSRQRKHEIREAIRKAKAEAEKEGKEGIEGKVLKDHFAPENGSNRSGIAESGIPDGSLQETYQVLAARNYGSIGEAREVADATVAEIKPVKKAKEGKKVREIDIARVRRDPFIKRHPVEEVVARVVKKRILAEKLGQKPVVIHEVQAESLEGVIEDNPDLAEVFQRAA